MCASRADCMNEGDANGSLLAESGESFFILLSMANFFVSTLYNFVCDFGRLSPEKLPALVTLSIFWIYNFSLYNFDQLPEHCAQIVRKYCRRTGLTNSSNALHQDYS